MTTITHFESHVLYICFAILKERLYFDYIKYFRIYLLCFYILKTFNILYTFQSSSNLKYYLQKLLPNTCLSNFPVCYVSLISSVTLLMFVCVFVCNAYLIWLHKSDKRTLFIKICMKFETKVGRNVCNSKIM